MTTIIHAIGLPLLFLNTFGGIAAAVWLLTLGEWKIVLLGVCAMVGGPFIVSLALLPGAVFALPAAAFLSRGHSGLALPFAFLGTVYTNLVVTVLSVVVFISCMDYVTTYSSVWPLALWAYTIAMSPWSFLASKDQQAGAGDFAAMTVFFAQLAFVAMAISVLMFRWVIVDAAFAFGAIMVINAVLQTSLAAAMSTAGARG